MKIEKKIEITFTNEEYNTINRVFDMFENYDGKDWELLEECLCDALYINITEWFQDLEKIRDYMALHS